MKSTDRCILALVALSDCQDVMAAQIHILAYWMSKKIAKAVLLQLFTMAFSTPPFRLESKVFYEYISLYYHS